MCTVSIRAADAGETGYDLWFSRDERLTRASEAPPTAGVTENGTGFVAPADGERGGTWLMLNAHGLTVVVLNDYESRAAGPGTVSRGQLPLACADCRDAADALICVRAWARRTGETRLGPFFLVAVSGSDGAHGLGWDGARWRETNALNFATSSSFRPSEIRRVREAAHAALASPERTALALARLHWTHDPAAGAESIRMRRVDACTRSVCHVRVRGDAISRLTYTPVDWATPDGVGSSVEASP